MVRSTQFIQDTCARQIKDKKQHKIETSQSEQKTVSLLSRLIGKELKVAKNEEPEEENLLNQTTPRAQTVITKEPHIENKRLKAQRMKKSSAVKAGIAKNNIGGILKPPFRIVQIGSTRSGSTWQFHLLDAIVHLKSSADTEIHSLFTGHEEEVSDRIEKNHSFVIKTHKEWSDLEKWNAEGIVSVFSSGSKGLFAHYNQKKDELLECSMCEINKYREFFDLTNDDLEVLKKHMSLFETIRQCCGLQMSKYNVQRLNGCDIEIYKNNPRYPNCEKFNMTDIELQFSISPIPYHEVSPTKNWMQPGDCKRYDTIIASGKGFNGEDFTTCEVLE